jgi:radical SAM protein with 4Fe4S-binding SPASM domain
VTLLPGRFINFIKVISGYFLSRLTRHVFNWGYPLAVSIEPTNRCNLHCPECPSGQTELTRPGGFMSPERFRSLIDQLALPISYLTLYFQGEPYLNPHFHEFIRYARSKKIYVSSSTNGHFLTPESATETVRSGLNRLIISLDGTDPETYLSYRKGGSFEKVTEGISTLARTKREMRSKTPFIVIQFLVLKTNQHQIDEIRKLGKELRADRVEIKSAQFYDFESGNPLIPDIEKYSRYEKTGNDQDTGPRYRIKNSLPRHCFRMWSSCVITWDGKVVPCCYDKNAQYQMGDLNKESFNSIWKSEKYNGFRKKILTQRETIDICKNCSSGIKISAV